MTEELKNKLDIIDQLYNGLDKPIPFKGGLKLYPVLVKDYYRFHRSVGCITKNKNVKLVPDESGLKMKQVANIKGLSSSYLKYLIDLMTDSPEGKETTMQLMDLFELVFHVSKGRYCPKCGKEFTYSEMFNGMEKDIESEYQMLYNELKEKLESIGLTEKQITEEAIAGLKQTAYTNAFIKRTKCPECGEDTRDNFGIKDSNGEKILYIKDVDITSSDFDELRAIIPRQNIVDYDDDVYINPELKAELEEKKRLQNNQNDYTSPSLERQIVCVAVGTGFSFEYLYNITMRKLTLLLRTVDAKDTYYAQYQGQMSGMVEYKHPIKHWIFSDDKPDLAKELTDAQAFEDKFKYVT